MVNAALNCTILNETCGAIDVYHISNETNAHAEQNNESDYDFIVCCNETQGYTLNNSHGTEVLTLSSSTNAHAEQNNESNYAFPIYLNVSNGTISCHYNTSSCSEACLGSLSDHTNAHTADCSTDPYSIYICCQWSASIPPVIPPPTVPGDGGEGAPPIFTNCTYYLDKDKYLIGEQINLTISCLADWTGMSYVINWQDTNGVLYNQSVGILGNTTTIHFTPPIAMNGIINLSSRGINTLLPFKVESFQSSLLGYGYILLIAGLGFVFFLIIDKSMQKQRYPEYERKKRSKWYKYWAILKKNAVIFMGLAVLSYVIMVPTELLGYLYVLGISLVAFIIIMAINNQISKDTEKKPEKKSNKYVAILKKNSIVLIILAAISYVVMKPTDWPGYLYVFGISLAVFIIIMFINKQISKDTEKRRGSL